MLERAVLRSRPSAKSRYDGFSDTTAPIGLALALPNVPFRRWYKVGEDLAVVTACNAAIVRSGRAEPNVVRDADTHGSLSIKCRYRSEISSHAGVVLRERLCIDVRGNAALLRSLGHGRHWAPFGSLDGR